MTALPLPDRRWPDLGRDAEVARISRALVDGRSVLLVGPAGSGKSHVSRRALADPGVQRASVRVVDDLELVGDDVAEELVVAARGGSVLLLACRSPRRLAPGLAALWRDGSVERVDLPPLRPQEVGHVLAAVLGGEVGYDVTWTLWATTAGNPLLLREIVHDAIDDGSLASRGGVWTLGRSIAPGPRLDDLVAVDLGGLTPDERAAVEVVALGEPLSPEVVIQLVGADALDRVVAGGMVVVQPPGAGPHGAGARLREPIFAEAVRRGIAPGARRRWFAEVEAAAPASPSAGTEAAIRRVAWSLECGITPPVDDLLRAAAASWHRDLDVPARLASAALDVLEMGDPRRVDALTLRGQAWRGRGRRDGARRDLDEALALLGWSAVDGASTGLASVDPGTANGSWSSDNADPASEERFRRAIGARVEVAIYNDLDPVTGHRLLEAAAAASAPERRGWFACQQLVHVCFGGRFPEVGDEVCRLQADPGVDAGDRAALTGVACVGLALQGRVGEAMERAVVGASLAEANADRWPWVLSEVQALWFTTAIVGGHLDIADELLGRAEHADRRPRIDRSLDQLGAGMGAAARGRWREALAHVRAASVGLEERDQTGLLSFALAHRARAAAAVGEDVEAWEVLGRLDAVPLAATAVVEGLYRLLRAEALTALGDPGAVDLAWSVAGWAAARGERIVELRAVHLAVVASAARPGGQAAATPDPTALDGITTDGTTIDERLERLAGDVDAPIARPLVAHARAVLAGDGVRAAALVSSLTEVGVWIPQPARRDELSAREWEVASLASSGMRSKDIASTLYLSVRTVDTHLARVYRKLGINRRDELVSALAVLRR